MIEVEINITEFVSRLRQIQENVMNLSGGLLDIGRGIDLRTKPFIPYKRGYLQESFEMSVQTLSNFIVLEYGYTGRYNPYKTDSDYALDQELNEDYRHPVKGEAHYTEIGLEASEGYIFQQLETDYLSCFKL